MPDLDGSLRDYFEHRARMMGSVLAVPVEGEGGEGLRETAFRATSKNGFRETEIVVELCRARSFRSISGMNEGSIDDLTRLVDVLGIRETADQVKKLLSNGGHLGKDWVRYFDMNIRRGHVVKARRVAPRSLRKADRVEAVWSLRPFGFDLKTKEVLLDHCPLCERSLGWSRTFGPSYCDRCPMANDPFRGAVNLADYLQPIVDVDDERAIDLVASLVDPAAATFGDPLHPQLKDRGSSEVFQLFVEIAGRLDGVAAGWGKGLSTKSIERAGRTLLQWPQGLDDLLAGSSSCDSKQAGNPFNNLHLEQTLSAEMRDLLKARKERIVALQNVGKSGGIVSVIVGTESPRPSKHASECHRPARSRSSFFVDRDAPRAWLPL